jgi:H+-transporting ATPase
MFLKLAVAGHLTIFITRTRGPFWSIAPAPALLWSAIGSKLLATVVAVYGMFMTPIGWKWTLIIWGYALVWALINDQLKLLAYKIFDPVRTKAKTEEAA